MQAIIEKIKKYIKLEKKAMNLINSIMPKSNAKGVELSIELNQLHHEITTSLEEEVIGWGYGDKSDAYAHNKGVVAQLISIFKAGIEPTYDGGSHWSFAKEGSTVSEFTAQIDETFIGEVSTGFFAIGIICSVVQFCGYTSSGSVHLQAPHLDTPTESDASAEIKKLASDLGKELIYETTGSYHEQFGVIRVDFS